MVVDVAIGRYEKRIIIFDVWTGGHWELMVEKVNLMIIVKLQHSVSDLSNTLTIEAPQHSVSIVF